MLQHENARPHAARICTQFLEDENISVLAWPHTLRTCHSLSIFGMLWISVYGSMFQFLPISSNFAQPLKRSRPTFHKSLCEGDVLHCVRQIMVTPDTDQLRVVQKTQLSDGRRGRAIHPSRAEPHLHSLDVPTRRLDKRLQRFTRWLCSWSSRPRCSSMRKPVWIQPLSGT